MSAFLCSENHLSLLANLSSDEPATQDAVFKTLLAENLRSLDRRYPYDAKDNADIAATMQRWTASPAKLIEDSIRKRAATVILLVIPDKMVQTQIVKCCDCYDYQACENDDYETTKAAAVVLAIRISALAKGGLTREHKLYNDLSWGLY